MRNNALELYVLLGGLAGHYDHRQHHN